MARGRSASLSQINKSSSPESLSAIAPLKKPGGGQDEISFSAKGMQVKSGGATLNMSAGKLSIASGNTQFDLHSLADGIKMQAKDTKSGRLSSFSMTSRGTEETHKAGKSQSRVQTKTNQFSSLANSVSDSMWQQGLRAATVGRNFTDIFADHGKKHDDKK